MLREDLIDQLTDWAIGEPTQFITDEEAAELADFLAPVIAKHLDAIAPPRDCCPTRRRALAVETPA